MIQLVLKKCMIKPDTDGYIRRLSDLIELALLNQWELFTGLAEGACGSFFF